MKNKNLSIAAGVVLMAGAMISSSTARAEELPQTKAHQQFSVTQGFREPALGVLHRAGAADQDQVSSALIEKLRPGSAYQSTKVGTKLRLTGKEWFLEVTGDGSGAEFQDQEVEGRAHALGKQLSEKMSAVELEQKGRAFIASELASRIVLGAGEELVAIRADYRTEGGQDMATGEMSQAVVANRIVFGRILRGVPVVGNGSKVILTFINDGSLESLRYDWPKYQVTTGQNLVGVSDILVRVQKSLAARTGVDAPTLGVTVPSSERDAYPVNLTPNTELQAMECGYFDSGSFAGHPTRSVQPGCTYRAVSHDSNGMRAGYAGAVPAGARFERDAAWPESTILGKE